MTTPGPYDTDVSDMYAVHQAILGALNTAPEYVAKTNLDPARVEVVGSFIENVIEFLHVHHSGEDEIIYPVLEQRSPENQSEIERVNDQHKLLDDPMDAGRSAVAAWRAAPSAETAPAVTDALAAIDEKLQPHFSDEEIVVLPIAANWISPEEWATQPGHAMMSFRADKPWLMMGLVLEQLSPEKRDSVMEDMPPEMQTMWTEQMEPAFNAFIAEVRR